MKIVFTSDLHLKKENDERLQALIEVCEEAKKNDAEHLIIGGDLFDEISDVRELGRKIGAEIFANYDFTVHIIPGNHDFEGFNEAKYFGKNVKFYLDYTFVDLENTCIHFFPFKKEKSSLSNMLFQLTNNKAEKNILVLHTNLNRFNFGEGEEKDYEYMESDLEDFSGKDIDLVLAGHIHSKVQSWGYEDGEFYYAGSPVSITKKEVGKRHALLVELNNDIKIDPIPLNTFHYEEFNYFFNLNDEKILNEMKERLRTIDEKSTLIGKISGFISGNEKEVYEKIEDILKDTNNEINIEIYEISQLEEDTIFKEYREFLEKEIEDEKTKIELLKEFIYADERSRK